MRIREENYFFGGKMPQEYALAWKAYLAGILEWGPITVADYWYLRGFLPDIEGSIVEDILCGRTLELPSEISILELEPKTIPQAPIIHEKIANDELYTAGPVPITKPKFINGRLE